MKKMRAAALLTLLFLVLSFCSCADSPEGETTVLESSSAIEEVNNESAIDAEETLTTEAALITETALTTETVPTTEAATTQVLKASETQSILLVTETETTGEPGVRSKSFVYSGNPTTGYIWSYTVEPEGIVKVNVKEANSNNPALSGASKTTYTFEVSGVKEGKATVCFSYARPWDGGETDTQEYYEFTIDSGLLVHCVKLDK